MKKLLFLLTLFAGLFVSNTSEAQNVNLTNMKTTWGATGASGAIFDTIKTTTPVYLYSGPVKGFRDVVTVTAVATEISGTTSGSVTIEVSQDGTTWSNYYNSRDTTGSKFASYNLTLGDVTTPQVYRWNLYNWGDAYVRIRGIGGGTVVVDLRGQYQAYTNPNR
jgi:hypothetical protein